MNGISLKTSFLEGKGTNRDSHAHSIFLSHWRKNGPVSSKREVERMGEAMLGSTGNRAARIGKKGKVLIGIAVLAAAAAVFFHDSAA